MAQSPNDETPASTAPACPRDGEPLRWYSEAQTGVGVGDIGYCCPACYLYVATPYRGGPIYRVQPR